MQTASPEPRRQRPNFRRSITMPEKTESAKWRSGMAELPSEGSGETGNNGDMAAIMENFQNKKAAMLNRLNSSQPAFSNEKLTQTSNAHVNLAGQSSSRTASKRAQLTHHVASTSSEVKSSLSSQEMKSNLSELKSSISEMKNMSEMKNISEMKNVSEMKASSQIVSSQSESRHVSRGLSTASLGLSTASAASCGEAGNSGIAGSALLPNFPSVNREFLQNSMESLDSEGGVGDMAAMRDLTDMDDGEESAVSDRSLVDPESEVSRLTSPNLVNSMNTSGLATVASASLASRSSNKAAAQAAGEMKFEQKKMSSSSKTKITTDGFSSEQATANSAQLKRLQAGDVSFQEASAAAAVKARLEVDGAVAEKAAAAKQEQRSLKCGELSHQESRSAAAATMKLHTDSFSAEKSAVTSQQQRQMVTSGGIFSQENHKQAASQSMLTITTKGVCTKSSSVIASQVSQIVNGMITNGEPLPMEDLELLNADSNRGDVENTIMKYSGVMSSCVDKLKGMSDIDTPLFLTRINEMMSKAWGIPTYGHELGLSLCNVLRNNGGLDFLIENCSSVNTDVQFSSVQLLEQCLTTENRGYVVEKGLETVVNVACKCTKSSKNSVSHSRVGTGILEHLFKHSEGTCSDVVKLGGLDTVLYECRKNDVETLRHCAAALTNLSLYGGSENQEAMMKRKAPIWLFPLAFHSDATIKYYACLAIAVLVANKEIEAAVLKSGTLDLVEPFVLTHDPAEFASYTVAHSHGQSKNWLQRLVPVLNSKREEASNLAAFHFCMEAGIKNKQRNTALFMEIGAIEPLKKVASSPNAVASKYAAHALRLIGEEVPHKLSQQVPLWSAEDVQEWVKQIGFASYSVKFVDSRVDGDLLLQVTEEMLQDDIGIANGILRKRFMRELRNLKKMADYNSCDSTNMYEFLQNLDSELTFYTYSLLIAGINRDVFRYMKEDHLVDCGIMNSIHRDRILEAVREEACLTNVSEDNLDKNLDVFISYRRSNGSQLASLLKVHLQLRGFSVYIDVERLEAGKFDNNLLQSIRQAKHFLLVLTPLALDRCIGDTECKDWVHKEIVAALQSQCNIIPITDSFQWPDQEELPEDMKTVCNFNGVRWIHDYQDACVDKLERFMRGEMNIRTDCVQGRYVGMGRGDATPSTPSNTLSRQHIYQRTHSNESGKGSSCSDKDINGNSGGGGKD